MGAVTDDDDDNDTKVEGTDKEGLKVKKTELFTNSWQGMNTQNVAQKEPDTVYCSCLFLFFRGIFGSLHPKVMLSRRVATILSQTAL